jgi:uncharacterized protein (DUF433 family)
MNPRINIDSQIQHGRPVIKGTRIPVLALLGCVMEGMSLQETAAEYRLPVEDVLAALDFAAELVEQAQQRPVVANR